MVPIERGSALRRNERSGWLFGDVRKSNWKYVRDEQLIGAIRACVRICGEMSRTSRNGTSALERADIGLVQHGDQHYANSANSANDGGIGPRTSSLRSAISIPTGGKRENGRKAREGYTEPRTSSRICRISVELFLRGLKGQSAADLFVGRLTADTFALRPLRPLLSKNSRSRLL